MRVLIVGLPRSPHVIRHANLLAGADLDVHFASVLAQEPDPDLDPRVVVHPHPAAPRTGSAALPDAGRLLVAAEAVGDRVLLAGWRLGAACGFDPVRWGVAAPGGWNPTSAPAVPALDPGLYTAIATVGVRVEQTTAWLARTIDKTRPDAVVSTGVEQCGFVTLAAKTACREPFPPWVVVSLGLDLNLMVRFAHFRPWSAAVLQHADALFLECWRDIPVARDLGFAGSVPVVAPIGGGWDVAAICRQRQPEASSLRRTVAVKGYGGWVGRGLVAMAGVRRAAPALLAAGLDVALFAAHDDVALAAELVAVDTGLRIDVWTRLPYDELLTRLGRCRAVVGMSAADAIATTALEAILVGAVPIQSRTSCIDEWVEDGRSGLLIDADDPAELAKALERVATDGAFVDAAVAANDARALPRLDAAEVNPRIVGLYRRLAETGA